jgi:hypothetical protein
MNTRKCIFTGNPSDFKLTMNNAKDDLHNWAKKIPCCKEYVQKTNLLDRPLNSREMKLIDLFYKQEILRLKIGNIEAQMVEIRKKVQEEENEYIIYKNITIEKDEKLTEEIKDDKVQKVVKKTNLWD